MTRLILFALLGLALGWLINCVDDRLVDLQFEQGYDQGEIASMYGVTQPTISQIHTRARWADLPDSENQP